MNANFLKERANRNQFEYWDEETDVIIIGSGFAGLSAAIEAREAGAEVIVLEKMGAPGGNSIISDGCTAAPGTLLQKAAGVADSPELMYEDMLKAGCGLNYPDLVKTVVNQAKEAFEWASDHLGVKYLDRVDIFNGHSVARTYTPIGVTGAQIIRRQLDKLSELGVSIRLWTSFREYLFDAEERVCGITTCAARVKDRGLEPAGKEKRIHARKGVILATGGFGGDVSFRMAQDPRLTGQVDTTNKACATAEALTATLRIGAAPVQLSRIQLGPWTSPDEKGFGAGPRFAEYIVFPYGIVVDPSTGKRVVNELADRKTVSDGILKTGHPCVGIAHEGAVVDSGWDISKAINKGVVRRFESIDAIASYYGISSEELGKAIARFNAGISEGVDSEFGKTILSGAKPMKPPYLAMRLLPKVHYTMGGVRIDPDAGVVDLEGNRIKGLYAAGEVTGGIHGADRLSSCAITECIVFGRIAGKNAAMSGS